MENNITSQEGVVKQTQIEGIENQDNHINLPKTEEELQALLQREADRRVSQAQKKWQEKQDAIIKAEKEQVNSCIQVRTDFIKSSFLFVKNSRIISIRRSFFLL